MICQGFCSDHRRRNMNRGSVFFEAFLSKKTSGDFVCSISTSISSADSCSFTFTGKEKDFESGYHYFGARYYDSEALTGWLSVDPMSDKYPSMSPYNYCAWNPVKLVDPNGDTLDVVNKKGQFLFSLDDNSPKGRSSITAKKLYDKGIQWSEPNADNYMPLLSVNKDIESIDGIGHFSWSQIEEFALTDRFMIAYRAGGSGDFKNGKEFLCTVDGIPYWTDIIGQIPFAINCYKIQLMNGKTHQEAANFTQKMGHLFANGFLSHDNNPNDADNWMIKRACDWASKGFDIGGYQRCGRYVYSEVKRNSYDFSKIAQWTREQ